MFSAEKRKKKAARKRGTNLTVIVIKDYSKGVPRGKKETSQLENDGLLKKVEIFRTMSVN